MRTADDMYEFCLDNDYGRGMTANWALKHFKVLEDNLRPDEIVYMTFMGLHSTEDDFSNGGYYAYAITSKRILFGQKKRVGVNYKSVVFDRFNDISFSSGLVFGKITFGTLGETFDVQLNKYTAENISQEAHRIIFDMRSKEGLCYE